MDSTEDVTQWIVRLSDGDERAAKLVWDRYFAKLVRYARRKLDGLPLRATDEEDVALSAMHSFCRGMARRGFNLNDREDLWKVLVTITARKACAQRRRFFAAKRGGGQVRGESAFLRADLGEGREPGIGDVLGKEPTPEFANMVADDCRAMLDRLGDDTLRDVAVYKLQGYSTEEIAEKLGCVRRSVERKLERIRDKWSKEILSSVE